MKASFLPRTPIDALLAVLVFWFGSSACDYLYLARGLKPLYSYIAVIVVAVFYAAAQGAFKISLAILRDKWTRRFVVWLLVYVVYGVLTFLESSQSPIAAQALITLVEMVMLGIAFSILMVHKRRLRLIATAFVLLAIFGAGMNLLDFIHPAFSNVPGRAAGLYINPNVAGYALALMMLCGVESVPARLRLLFVLLCGVGVLVTFSRSAWIMWGVTVMWLGWRGRAHNVKWKLVVMVVSTALGLGFLVAAFSGELGMLMANTPIARYLDPNTLARLGVGDSSLSGDSAATRTDLIWYSLHVAAQNPLLGLGSGYVYEWAFPVGPHNMYLRFLVEGGVFGLVFYVALMALLWCASSGSDRILVLQIVIASFFSHNLLESPVVIIVVTFMLARLAMQQRDMQEMRLRADEMVMT